MDAHQLRREAVSAIGQRTQQEVANDLSVSAGTISHAFNHDTPSRYAGTLKNIIERYTDISIESETTTVYRAKKKG